MIKSKIMSYITQDFQSKSDLIVGGEEWQKAVLKMQSKFAKAGAIRQTVSQVLTKMVFNDYETFENILMEKLSWLANYCSEKQNNNLIKLKYLKNYFRTEVLSYMMFIFDRVMQIKVSLSKVKYLAIK